MSKTAAKTTKKALPEVAKGKTKEATAEKPSVEKPGNVKPTARTKGAKGATAATAKPEPQAAPAAPAAKKRATGATKAPGSAATARRSAEPRTRDERLPKPGTVLEKRDRHSDLRCPCT